MFVALGAPGSVIHMQRWGDKLPLARESDSESNPYAPPRAASAPAEPPDLLDAAEAEQLRRAHLPNEAAIRAVGLGCILAAPLIVFLFYRYTTDENTVWQVFFAFMVVVAAIPLALGFRLRAFRGGARWGAIAFLLLFGCLTGWLAWIGELSLGLAIVVVPLAVTGLGILATRSASTVCRRSYRRAVAMTPHIRRRKGLIRDDFQ